MEASTRILSPSSLRRHLLPKRSLHLLSFSPLPNPNPNPRNPSHSLSLPRSPAHFLSSSKPCRSFLSLSSSQLFPSNPPQDRLDRHDLTDSSAFDGVSLWDLGFAGEKGEIWTVVLLGWLGAEEKHLKRYAEMYSAKGIRSVRFVVSVRETLSIDLCRKVEGRIAGLARELVSWCSESEKDGIERNLIFHTFSNTGWLTYGVILQNLQSRKDIIQKIKGCVVDSGASAEINSQVWAAGYCAALLKKRSSLTHASAEPIEGGKIVGRSNGLNTRDIIPVLIETIVFKIFEIFFSLALMLPYANQRLISVISTLKDQPPCPQLYLYSSADKVIPARSVECFIQEQKALGRKVHAHDFGSTPHVDHYRNFPHIYSAKVNEFLKDCFPAMVCKP